VLVHIVCIIRECGGRGAEGQREYEFVVGGIVFLLSNNCSNNLCKCWQHLLECLRYNNNNQQINKKTAVTTSTEATTTKL